MVMPISARPNPMDAGSPPRLKAKRKKNSPEPINRGMEKICRRRRRLGSSLIVQERTS